MNSIFAKLLYMTQEQHDVMLITIIAANGSAPRGSGSQMLVGRHGRLIGTIGGGAVEYRSEELARELLEKKQSLVHTFPLHESDAGDIGMVCGGDVTVHLQYIPWNDTEWNTLAGKLLDQMNSHRRGWLILHLNGATPSLIDADHTPLCGYGAEDCLLRDGFVLQSNDYSIPLPVGERAILFGAGHCSQALAPLLKTVGFRVTVFDDRAALANDEAFPTAEQVVVGDFRNISDSLTLQPEDYVVVMTSGHSHDFEVQRQILRQKLAYVGVIGSRSKTAVVNEKLRQTGISEDAIACVHTPVGTAIKAVTPEEIAVSIAGEMIYVRACRREAGGIEIHGCPVH
ncbi:MAG: xanthine dehydrogenase accessory protein XdhC [Clostridiales bacterium]|nr:xanthine dehydrogenase accessory protein XdhC [Candidatus Cacconaster stercorequi]